MWLKNASIILPALLWTSINLSAQGLFESSVNEQSEKENKTIQWNGFGRGSIMAGSEYFDYSNAFGELGLQTRLNQKNLSLFSDLRFRKGLEFDKKTTSLEIKELYAGYTSSKFDLMLGQQIISWGRADGFNPTNNLTPNNYFFLSAEPDDQKIPNFLLRARYRINDFTDIDLAIIPFYEPSVYRYELFAINPNASFAPVHSPENSFKNTAAAIKLNFDLPAAGFSISAFRGYDPFYGFTVSSIEFGAINPVIVNTPTPYQKTTLGADLALPLGSWIFRTEAALNLTKDFKDNMHIPNPNLYYVSALEKNIKGFTLTGQYIGKHTLDFAELQKPVLPNQPDMSEMLIFARQTILYESELYNRKIFGQQEAFNHAASLSINKDFFYQTLNLEFTALYNFTSEEYLLRPKIQWRISDALSASLGGSWMFGPEASTFHYASKILNGAFLELKASF